MAKTYEEINEKISKGKAVVVTAEEMIGIVREEGEKKAAEKVDVVTTGTFGTMCSSGAFLNLGHSKPRIKIQKAWLNEVEAYAGLAAVDLYIGATQVVENDPLNSVHPGEFKYGGGHVIEELIAGKDVKLVALAHGTDCYPRKSIETHINIRDLNEAMMVNPRNGYQNYNVAVNLSDHAIYTYMGMLKPKLGSANYCSAGQMSPLLNDPYYRTIGIGTRIFLGGGSGYVFWQGTQHSPNVPRNDKGVPVSGAGTLAVVGDMKQMSTDWVRGVSFYGYGTSVTVGLGVPIPVLDEEMARFTAVSDEDIVAPVVDYSRSYPYGEGAPKLAEVTYAKLKSGKITVNGKEVPATSLSSYPKAVKVAKILKEWIEEGRFLLGKPVQLLPSVGSEIEFKPLLERAERR
jgi:uncharacterized protein (DUF39 family)